MDNVGPTKGNKGKPALKPKNPTNHKASTAQKPIDTLINKPLPNKPIDIPIKAINKLTNTIFSVVMTCGCLCSINCDSPCACTKIPGITPSSPSSTIAKGVRCLSVIESTAPIKTIFPSNHALGMTLIACAGNVLNGVAPSAACGRHAICVHSLFEFTPMICAPRRAKPMGMPASFSPGKIHLTEPSKGSVARFAAARNFSGTKTFRYAN